MLLYALWQNILAFLPSPELPLTFSASDRITAAEEARSVPEYALDLNAATLEELISLPGIGEKTAQTILELRERIGGFHYPEDLLLVHGIGVKKLDAIYDLVYVRK